MFKLLRYLSPKDEIIIVTVAAFGYSVVASIWGALTFEPGAPLFFGPDLKFLVLDELLILAVLAGFLRVRGWTFDLIGLGPDIRETFTGLGLAISVEVLARVLWLFVALSSSHVLDAGRTFNPVEGKIDPIVLIVVSVINPIYEELFLCGYLVTALKERLGPWAAINISVGIRLVCHLYQGIVGIIFIVPTGLIFTYWYARRGRLWPLIVAHVLLDFFPLLPYMGYS